MASLENVVKTVRPKSGELCTACVNLIPGEHTVPLHSKDWGTLKSLTSSAHSCSLCAIILSGRQSWLEAGREYKEDVGETTIDECPLRLTLTKSQLCESGVSSNTLAIFLTTGIFSFPHFFFIMGCESEGTYVILMAVGWKLTFTFSPLRNFAHLEIIPYNN